MAVACVRDQSNSAFESVMVSTIESHNPTELLNGSYQ
jgi:hypothetical protein